MRAAAFVRYVARRHPGAMALVVFLLLATALAEAASALAIAPVVDLLLARGGELSRVSAAFARVLGAAGLTFGLPAVLGVFLGVNFLRAGLHALAWNSLLRTRYAVLRETTLGTFEDFFAAGWRFFAGSHQGTMINTFTRELQNLDGAFMALGQLLSSVFQFAFYLAVPLILSWRVTLASAAAGLVMAAPFFLLGRLSYRLGRQVTDASNRLTSAVQENLSLAKVVLGFGNEKASVERLRVALQEQTEPLIAAATLSQTVPALFQPLGLIVVCAALLSARRLEVPLAETAALFYALFKLVPIIGQFVERKNALDSYLPSFEQIVAQRREAASRREPSGGKPFPGLTREVALEGVSFAPEGAERTLAEATIRVPRGEMVAMVGESGAGKTTAVDLLAGLLRPSAGRVSVDGVSLAEYDSRSYRARVGYVTQDDMLFDMTVRENLLWAKPDATEDELTAAARKAAAHDFIMALPQGYGTRVGDRGVRLSGGQVQRVALARAILRRPDLLVLDEATSALDGESERLVHEALARLRGECAVVLIAHRLATVRDADRIYVLKAGRVVEEGRYDELIARGGDFARMAKLQSLAAAEAA